MGSWQPDVKGRTHAGWILLVHQICRVKLLAQLTKNDCALVSKFVRLQSSGLGRAFPYSMTSVRLFSSKKRGQKLIMGYPESSWSWFDAYAIIDRFGRSPGVGGLEYIS